MILTCCRACFAFGEHVVALKQCICKTSDPYTRLSSRLTTNWKRDVTFQVFLHRWKSTWYIQIQHIFMLYTCRHQFMLSYSNLQVSVIANVGMCKKVKHYSLSCYGHGLRFSHLKTTTWCGWELWTHKVSGPCVVSIMNLPTQILCLLYHVAPCSI